MNSKLTQLLTTVSICATIPAWAVNPPGSTCSTGCKPCCEGESDGGGTGDAGDTAPTYSLEWSIQVGLTRYAKPTTLTDFGQAAYEKNGSLPNFNQMFGRYFSSSPLQQRQIHLELNQPQISAATFHPSCLFLQSEATFETLKKPAANGFPEFIYQILTDDAFTLIDVLPAPDSGWRLRTWKRDAVASLTTSSGYYVTTGFIAKTPLTDVTFKRPLGSSGNNTLLYTKKATTGSAGTRTTTNEITQTLDSNGKPATVTSKLFVGDGTSGSLLSQEDLTYTERGSKVWDYTIIREVRTSSVDAFGSIGALTLTSKTREDYDDFSATSIGGELGMKRLVSRTEAFDLLGQSPQTTTYTYIQTPTNPTTHGRLESSIKPDGSWTYSEYAISASSPVSVSTEYSGWRDLTMAQRENARKTVTTVSANETTTETTLAGQLISKSRITLGTIGNDPVTTSERFDGNAWHATTTSYYPDTATAPSTGRIKWIENSDGTAATYTYATVSGKLVMTARTGAGTRSGITAGTEVKTTHGLGNFPIAQITKDIASGLITEQWDTDPTYNSGFDQLGRPIKRIYNADVADYDIAQYACCGLEFSRDRMGATATYSRDGLKRVFKFVTKVSPNSPDVSTFTTIDGLTTTNTRSIGGQSLFLGSQTTSIDGLTRTITDPSAKSTAVADRRPTTIVTIRSATGDTATTTFADSSTSITASYLDGRIKSISGTAVPDMTYDYATHTENGGGETSSTNASGVVTTRFTDLLGRTRKTVSGATGTTSHAYHPLSAASGSRTKLLSVTDGDGVILTYGYNGEGAQTNTYRSIPLPGNTTATQVTTTDEDVVPDATLHGVSLGISIRRTQTISSTGIDPITVSESYVSRDRLMSASSSLGSHTVSETTRPDSSGIATRTTIRPDGTRTVETLTHGLATRVENQDASTAHNVITATDYGYDLHQRLETVTDSRTGSAGKTTYSNFTESGAPLTTTEGTTAPNIRVTSVVKDIFGRVIQTTLPDDSVAHASYWPTGQIRATWGSQTNPVFHIYDEQNRPKELHTWQTAPTLTQTTAAPPAGSARTEWIYAPTGGHLVEKNHPGETDNGITDPDYTHTPAGRLLVRTWERGVTTTYGYTHGMMTSTDYSDSTPDVSITYEPLGRRKSVSNGLATSVFTYAADLGPDKEIITYTIPGQSTFTRVLDLRDRSYGRDTGWDLGSPGPVDSNGVPTVVDIKNTADYSYSTTGRLETVSNGTDIFSYGYVTGSSLLKTVTKAASGANPALVATRNYETTRDTLAAIENNAGTIVRSKYDYAVVNGGVNSLGQRMGVQTTFNLGAAHTHNSGNTSWGYDNLGQLTAANLPGVDLDLDRTYAFDSIGNRLTAAKGNFDAPGVNSTFAAGTNGLTEYFGAVAADTPSGPGANALNQYAAIKTTSTIAKPVHDFDGNLRFDGGVNKDNQPREYIWDAENRLIAVKRVSDGSTLVSTLYDAQFRRIATTAGGTTTLYLYDGFNCIAEYTGTTLTTRTWGLDLSGTLQGAGGVGGLLAEKQGSNTFYPTYDGNGNVSEYLEADGDVAAHFEYDPFGNIVKESYAPSYDATSFSYKFSTKPLDLTIGLYYYTYRYYDPVTGRWPSRDPIEESGGMNLYGFVGNNGVNKWDYLGNCETKNPDDKSTVYLECSAVKRNGATIGFHCSVVTKCADKPTIRIEDIGPRKEHKEHNDRKKQTDLGDDYLDKKSGWTRYEVECEKDQCCKTYCCLEKASKDAQFVPYDPMGPNSNTFARALLGKCGCKIKSHTYNNWGLLPFPYYNSGETSDPWGARGWQTDPPNYWPNR